MDSFSLYFLLFILAVLLGSIPLIYFGLKSRENFQRQNLKLSPEDIWKVIAKRALGLGLSKENMLYGIYQDASSTTVSLVVKDSQGQIIGRAEKTMAEQQARIFVGDSTYLIEYQLMKWNRTLELRRPESGELLATCEEKTFPIGKLHYQLADKTRLISERNYFSLYYQDNFRSQGKVIGTAQSISQAIVGRITILPPEIPLPVRIFILAHSLF